MQRSFTAERINVVAASSSGSCIAAGSTSGTVCLWDTASGRLLRSWAAHYKVRSKSSIT